MGLIVLKKQGIFNDYRHKFLLNLDKSSIACLLHITIEKNVILCYTNCVKLFFGGDFFETQNIIYGVSPFTYRIGIVLL